MSTFHCHGCDEDKDYSKKRYIVQQYVGSRFESSNAYCEACWRLMKWRKLRRERGAA